MANEEDELRALAIEADVRAHQIRDVQSQLQMLAIHELEIDRSIAALRAIKERGTALFALGGGVYTRGELKAVDKLLVDVGAGTVLEKTVSEAIEILERRRSEIVSARQELLKAAEELSRRLREVDISIRKLIEKKEQ